jgi:hypothetical protein
MVLGGDKRKHVEDRPAELLALDRFRRKVPHLTGAAMSKVLQQVDKEDPPTLNQRKHISEAQEYIMLQRLTPYGPLQRSVYVHGSRIEVINPQAMLWQAVRENGGYARMLRETLDRLRPTRDSPLRLALYSDEVTPGNVISPDNLRKCWAIYWGILDVYPQALHDEDAWFLLAVKRSSEVEKIDGKFSAIFGCMIEQFFTGGAHDCSIVGFEVEFLDGASYRIYLSLEHIIQDDAAHKTIWNCVGAAGSNFCMLCLNAWATKRQKKKALDDSDSDSSDSGSDGGIVCESTTTADGMDLATDDDIREKLAKLDEYHADPKMKKTQFTKHEQALGMKRSPHGIWRMPRIRGHVRPCRQWVPDWMHVMAVHGVINKLLFVVLRTFATCGIQWDVYEGYLAEWHWPMALSRGGNPSSVFKSKRIASDKKAKAIKCQASEALMFLPVLALFVQTSILPGATGAALGACLALLALANVLDLLMLTPRGCVESAALQAAVETFLALCKEHYPSVMVKKFHSLMHLAMKLKDFGMLLTCWVHERKHRLIRRFCNDVLNTTFFERSVMGNVVCQHLYELGLDTTFDYTVGLINPREASKLLRQTVCNDLCGGAGVAVVHTARLARCSASVVVANRDVVFVKRDRSFIAAYIWRIVAVAGRSAVLAQLSYYTSWDSDAGFAIWELDDDPTWILLEDVLDPCIFCWLGPRTFKTLLGSLYR